MSDPPSAMRGTPSSNPITRDTVSPGPSQRAPSSSLAGRDHTEYASPGPEFSELVNDDSNEEFELPDAMQLLGLTTDSAMDGVGQEEGLPDLEASFTEPITAVGKSVLLCSCASTAVSSSQTRPPMKTSTTLQAPIPRSVKHVTKPHHRRRSAPGEVATRARTLRASPCPPKTSLMFWSPSVPPGRESKL